MLLVPLVMVMVQTWLMDLMMLLVMLAVMLVMLVMLVLLLLLMILVMLVVMLGVLLSGRLVRALLIVLCRFGGAERMSLARLWHRRNGFGHCRHCWYCACSCCGCRGFDSKCGCCPGGLLWSIVVHGSGQHFVGATLRTQPVENIIAQQRHLTWTGILTLQQRSFQYLHQFVFERFAELQRTVVACTGPS